MTFCPQKNKLWSLVHLISFHILENFKKTTTLTGSSCASFSSHFTMTYSFYFLFLGFWFGGWFLLDRFGSRWNKIMYIYNYRRRYRFWILIKRQETENRKKRRDCCVECKNIWACIWDCINCCRHVIANKIVHDVGICHVLWCIHFHILMDMSARKSEILYLVH